MSKVKYHESRKVENIRSALRASERLYGDRPAFMQKVDGEYKTVTYSRFRDMYEALGTELWARGFAGKRIIVTGDNCLDWATVYIAVVSGLGVIVPVDKDLPDEELQNIVDISEAAAVFYSPRLSQKVSALTGGIEKFSFDDIAGLIEAGRARLLDGERDYLRAHIDPDAMTALIFTSGTTGTSKGVMLSHRNICFNFSEVAQMAYIGPEEVFLSVLPMHHVYECTCGFLFPLYRGCCVAFSEGLRYITRNIQEVRPTIVCCVPILLETIYRKIWMNIRRKGIEKKVRNAIKLTRHMGAGVKRKVFAEIHDSLGGRIRMFICGGAAADPAVMSGLRDFGLLAIQGYGLTECAPLAAVNKDDYFRDDSAGLATPNGVLDIYDVQNDGTGEIRYKGDNVMLGYYRNPELTAEVIRDGWFYTGDLGYIDPDGFLHITGRKKNVIVTPGGKNIFPEELEAYLCRNRFIAEAVVVGYFNESHGNWDIVAVLYPDDAEFVEAYGRGYTQGQIDAEFSRAVEEVNGIVQSYKRITMYIVRNTEFPKNSSRKIKRAGIAEESEAEYRKKLVRA
ncbi:MAG: AMP-dependent synthetase/ligase [Eubacteriales bacterium]